MTLQMMADVTKPAQEPCFEVTKQGAAAGSLRNDLVSDLAPPRDASNTVEALHVQTVMLSYLLHVCWPSFGAFKKST